ncbi:MAG: ATP-binding cassette domain-containing protein, partial [Fimbriimonadales bacterium]|nr:ATP-binding cassette domain-containing protein [Fimbriimonadales bacterium]
MSLAVRLQGISKRFGAVQALERVDLTVDAGSLHAVVGENGAGKTTLMRVLYGAIHPDAGIVEVEGERRAFRNSRDAIAAGIGMVSQHYSILPQLTCLQNLMLGAEPGAWIDEAAAARRADELAERMGFSFDWRSDAAALSPAAAQKLEILKLLWRRARILILDEPTAMLSPADSDALFESLEQLRREGATVLLVTHRLPEVMQHADEVTVLRGGRLVASLPVAQTDAQQLAQLIVGHALGDGRTGPPGEVGGELLELRGLTVRGYRGDDAVRGAD